MEMKFKIGDLVKTSTEIGNFFIGYAPKNDPMKIIEIETKMSEKGTSYKYKIQSIEMPGWSIFADESDIYLDKEESFKKEVDEIIR